MSASLDIDPRIALSPAGLTLGATKLAPVPNASDRRAADAERLETLFAVAFRRLPSDRDHLAIEAASMHWRRGEKALANLRLVVADLPQLQTPDDVFRLKAAELLYDAGLRTDDLASVFELDPPISKSGQYDPNQRRVPAGSGPTSGRWTKLWERFSAWLDAEVPEYDQDTGTEVGTQSRARAIVTNPLSVGVVGTAALLGGEAVFPAATAAAADAPEAVIAIEDTETLAAFTQRYLSTSGGRLGNTTTRQQLREIAREYVKSPEYSDFSGDGEGPEEYIPGVGPGTMGGTFVDFTAKAADGTTIRIQTIDTLADGITPAKYELEAAARIRAAKPDDRLLLIPKRKP